MVENRSEILIYVTNKDIDDKNLSAFLKAAKQVIIPSAVISCHEIEEFCDTINFNQLPEVVLFNGKKRISSFVGKWEARKIKDFVYENGVFAVEKMPNISVVPNMRNFLVLRLNEKQLPESVYELAQSVHVFYIHEAYDSSYENAGYADGGNRDTDVWINLNGYIVKFDEEYNLSKLLEWIERVKGEVL